MNQITKVSWREIKNRIKNVNDSLYQVIEQINPDENMPFFLARYRFGEHFGVKNHAYLPTASGHLKKIDSCFMDNELAYHLSYGKDSLPLGIILDKYCEWHYFGEDDRVFPNTVQGPGAIFNMHIVFDEDKTVDNNVLSVSSGALSSFMLPNIGCARKHARIQRNFNITAPAPKSPYEHHRIFTEILRNNIGNTNWHSEVLYCSQQFVEQVKNNDQWLQLKLYFSEALRKKLIRNTFDTSCNDLFLSARKINRYRPSPFILDTAKYIFSIAMGYGIGVKPAVDDQYLPLRDLQKIYSECYGLDYIPTLIVPSTLDNQRDSVYYPLQCPFAKINAFKTNQSNSTLTELETLKNVLLAYQDEFTEENGDAYNSPLFQVSKSIEFTFYHYMSMGNGSVKSPSELLEIDQRFSLAHDTDNKQEFSSDAKLFRGCVRLSRSE